MTVRLTWRTECRHHNSPIAGFIANVSGAKQRPWTGSVLKEPLHLRLPPPILSAPFHRRQPNKRTNYEEESIIVMVSPRGEWSRGSWHIHPHHTQHSTLSPLSFWTAHSSVLSNIVVLNPISTANLFTPDPVRSTNFSLQPCFNKSHSCGL